MTLTACTIHTLGVDARWHTLCERLCAQLAARGIDATTMALRGAGAVPRVSLADHPVVLLTDSLAIDAAARARVLQWHLLMPGLLHVTIATSDTLLLLDDRWIGSVAEMLTPNDVDADVLWQRIRLADARMRTQRDKSAQTESRFATLVRNSGDGVLVCDAMRQVHYVNPAAEQLLDLPADAVLGRSCPVPFDGQRLSTTVIEHRDGARHTLAVRAVDIVWDEMPAVLVTCQDLTEVQQMMQLQTQVVERERLDRQKDQFLHTVAHEVRGPLAVMQASLANLLAEAVGPTTPEQQKVLQIANRNIDRLTRMLTSLLSLARLESGGAVLEWHDVDLVRICDDVVTGMRALAASRGITLTLDAVDAQLCCRGDADLLTQLVTNIVGNALRFARAQVTVQLRAAQSAADGPHLLTIEIFDDGPGIPGSDPMVVFNRFTQLARQTQPGEYKGTGLGLAICRDIVERHRGTIWAENQATGGACFTIWLPRLHDQHPVWTLMATALQQAQMQRDGGIVAVLLQQANAARSTVERAKLSDVLTRCIADAGTTSLRRGDHGVFDAALGAFVCNVAGVTGELWIVANRLQQRMTHWCTEHHIDATWYVRVVTLGDAAWTVANVLSQVFTPTDEAVS